MKLIKRVQNRRERRAFRVRNRIRSAGRLRLSVFRSNRHMYAQIVDDEAGVTLVSANTMEGAVMGPGKYAGNLEAATKVGELLASRAQAKGITEVAFDRGDYKYHGRVKALAEAARAGGLQF
ncbi:MAG: 50S ribosomal protein L18 [Planctomycetaceae bacterium]